SDLPGYKNDHKHYKKSYKKSDGGFNQKMDQEDLKTYTAAFLKQFNGIMGLVHANVQVGRDSCLNNVATLIVNINIHNDVSIGHGMQYVDVNVHMQIVLCNGANLMYGACCGYSLCLTTCGLRFVPMDMENVPKKLS
ncbi:hypothetical protein Tco_0312987, partial [Tanacetum coccineum]